MVDSDLEAGNVSGQRQRGGRVQGVEGIMAQGQLFRHIKSQSENGVNIRAALLWITYSVFVCVLCVYMYTHNTHIHALPSQIYWSIY